LDIGVLGYIGIVWPKEHSPEVWSVPPVTLCIMMTWYLWGHRFLPKPSTVPSWCITSLFITWNNRKLVRMSVERCHTFVADSLVLRIVIQQLRLMWTWQQTKQCWRGILH